LHLVHQYLPEHVGGVELYTRWLTQAQARQGHQVAIFYRRSAEGVGREMRAEGDVCVWAAWAGATPPTRRFLHTFRDPPMISLWEQTLVEFAPDLVHVEHLMGLPVALIRVLRQRRIPYVITLWDFWWVCANAQLLTNYDQRICEGPRAYLNCARCALARAGRSGLYPVMPPLAGLMAWRNCLLRQVMVDAGALIAPTEFVHRWYAAHRAPQERLVTLLPGMEEPELSPRTPRAGGPLRFAYIGGLSRQKGVHTLVEAFSGVLGDAELWIAGDESFDPDYVARLRKLATPNVRFLGRLSREAVWDTLAQADVVTVPTLWYETFSFIVSEAFAAGLPVLASRLGPLVDRVRNGVDGLLLPPGDVSAWRAALQRMVDEPDFLARLRDEVCPPVTLEEHVGQVEVLYSQILEENTPR
ncbi:MAG TPA: glycosyltransferase, partial [Chloroflexi bacterium]|nr:glycosyltransferase [Chloroflexota bacterium]